MVSVTEKLGTVYGGAMSRYGKDFNDAQEYQPHTWGDIKEITIYWNGDLKWDNRIVVNGIVIVYSGGQAVEHGSKSGSEETIELTDGEFINKVSGRSGWKLDSLTLTTNKGRTFGPYGGDGGREFTVDFKDKALVAIFGQADTTITSIGFVSGELVQNNAETDNLMPKTLELIDSILLAEDHTSQIEDRVENIDQELEDIRNELARTKDLSEALDNLSTSLEVASTLLGAVSVIPKIGIAASGLKKTIDVLSIPVDKATKAAQTLEQASKEIRGKIYTVEAKVEDVDQKLLEVLNVQNQFVTVLGDAQLCINTLPASEHSKQDLIGKIEQAAESINPIVRNLDSVQKEFINGIKTVESNIERAEDWAGKILKIQGEVNRVLHELNPMIKTLEEIKQALKKTVSVPYGFKVKTCYKRVKTPPFGSVRVPYPCNGDPIYYRFSVWQIVTGTAKAIKPVMDLLNKGAYKVLQPLLRKLNLNINLSGIPGVQEIEELRNQLESAMNIAIDDFTKLLVDIDGPVREFHKKIDDATETIKDINDKCHLNLDD